METNKNTTNQSSNQNEINKFGTECPVCHITCKTVQGLRLHTRKKHKEDNEQQNKMATNVNSLPVNATSSQSLAITECSQATVQVQSEQHHELATQDLGAMQLQCEDVFAETSLRTPKCKLKCECCDKHWKTKRSLNKHLAYIQSSEAKIQVCASTSGELQSSINASRCGEDTLHIPNTSEDSIECNCCNKLWKNKRSLEMHQKRKQMLQLQTLKSTTTSKELHLSSSSSLTTTDGESISQVFETSEARVSELCMVSTRRRSSRISCIARHETQNNSVTVTKKPIIAGRKRKQADDKCEADETAYSTTVHSQQASIETQEEQLSFSPSRLHGLARKNYLSDMKRRKLITIDSLMWSKNQMKSEDPKYLKLKSYHDLCCGTFDNLATMKMSKEIQDVIEDVTVIEERTEEDKRDQNKYKWSRDDEAKLKTLTADAKHLQPPRWPWNAPDDSTQGGYNRARMEHVVKNELQYKILKCPTCGVTAVLVGEEQLELTQCIDCLELSRKKPTTQKKLMDAWTRVRPKDEVPKKEDKRTQQGQVVYQDLPKLNPSEQALIALVQPVVTIKRNYISSLKYKQESLNILQAAEKTWCKLLPRTDLHNRFVIIERRFRDAKTRYMVADPCKVGEWLQYLFTHHGTYMKKKENNQLELSQEALQVLEQQSELADVNYDIDESNSLEVDDMEHPPPSAELDSGLSTTELYTFDKNETLYTKKQNVMKMIGDGKIKVIEEDDPTRRRTFNPHISSNTAFPHLYPNGEETPTDFEEHTIARYLLKKQSQFAQVNSEGKLEWRHAENGVHMMHEYARIVEMNVHATVGWYINQKPERTHIPIDSLLDSFREGIGEQGIINTRMPELHGLMTSIRNSREKWFAERQMMEAISRDCGDANLFCTLNMDARAWPDVRKLLYELEEGPDKEMPKDYYEIDTEKFTRMVDKYAVQLSIYLKHRADAFSRAFLCDICRIEQSKWSKRTDGVRDRTDEGWFWQRVEFTSTRGIQHWHCMAKLPGVLDTSVLARMIHTMRVVRTELKFGNIKDMEKAWKVIEVGLLASRYLVLFMDSLSTCSFFTKEMSSDTFEENAVINIESLRQEFTDSYMQKDINRRTHPIMRRYDDEHCDDNTNIEMAKVASVSCMHNCITKICGGDQKTGKGCRFQYPHKKLKYTVPALIQIDSERMELQLLPRRTCDRVPNLQKLFLQYYRGNHDFSVLVDAAHKLRYVSKYVTKTGQVETLMTEVIESLDQKSKSLASPSVKHALSNILLADCSHKAYMSKSELAYNVMDLPKVNRSFPLVKTVAFYPRATVIEECPNSESGIIELSDRTEYSAHAERCRECTEVKGRLTREELEQMNLREFAESIMYKWKKKNTGSKNANNNVNANEQLNITDTEDIEPDDDPVGRVEEQEEVETEAEEDNEESEIGKTSKDSNSSSRIKWKCRDVKTGYWVMSYKRTRCHIKWSNNLYTDKACNYEPDESVGRFSELDYDRRQQLQRVYMEMVCYIPWKENPDQCFLPATMLQQLNDVSSTDPDVGCRYSLLRLHEYQRIYMEKWHAGQIAPPGSQWHRDNQYSYTMYLANLHNRSVKQDRASNDGVFLARYEGDDEVENAELEISPNVTTLYDADEYPTAANYLPCDILEEIQNQEPLNVGDLFVAFPEHTEWKDLKARATRKSSGLFMASPPVPSIDISHLSPMQKLAVDLIDAENNKVKVLYLYGKAGSGKTVVAQFLCQKFIGKVQAAAGTGKAASNFNGPTIHGAFGWSADIANQSRPLTQKKKQMLQVFYQDTELFIFDEINASPAYTLCHIDRVMRELFSPINTATGKAVDVPFGGKRVVFLGDSAQLRPIRAAAIYDTSINAKLFGYKSNAAATYINDTKAGQHIYRRHLMPNCIYLFQGHRNTGLLQKIMDDLREGKQTDKDLDKVLYQRQKYPDFITNRGIHYSNDSAMAYNCRQLWSDCNNLKRHLHISRATYHMTETNSNVVSVLSKIPASDYNYAQDVFCLAVGAEVRLITNLDTASGLVTNLTGMVTRIIYDDSDKDAVLRGDHPPPYCVVVRFPSFKGFVTSQGNDRWCPFDDHSLVPIYRQKFQLKAVPDSVRKLQKKSLCYREQFPLDLSGHLTAHRAQGQTFRNCTLAVSLGFESPQNKIPADAASIMYVACTRITNLKDLFVSPIFPSVWNTMGNSQKDKDRRQHEKELKVCAETFAREVNVYHHFLTESKFHHDYSGNEKEWEDIVKDRLLPCESTGSMLSSDSEVATLQEALEKNKLIAIKPAVCQRYIGIDQGVKTFSMVAIDKAENTLPIVVGAEQCDLQRLGLPERFKVGDLILMLQNHTSLFSWMNGDLLPESPASEVPRVVVLVEQMSLKNKNHKVFNEEFGRSLQRFVNFEKCMVKMSQPHVHRKNGPMFKLGEEIVKELKLESICYQGASKQTKSVTSNTMQQSSSEESEEEEEETSDQLRAQRQQYRKKKRMSSSIFKYFISATEAEQSAMQVLVSKALQEQWRQQEVHKYDDLGDGLLHALNELLCGGSRYRQLIPTAPTLHRNRTVALTILPWTGYWVTLECYYNRFVIQDVGIFKTNLGNSTYRHSSTISLLLKNLPKTLLASITEFEASTPVLSSVDQIKVIVKQLKGFRKARISGAAAGSLTNAALQAIKTGVDNALPGGQASASNTKSFGWQYVRSLKETGQKIELVRSSGKHLNAVTCCLNWMRRNVPEFVRDRPLKLSPEGKLKFFSALSQLGCMIQDGTNEQNEQPSLEFIQLSPHCQQLCANKNNLLTDSAKKVIADLILIALNNNSQYISAISKTYRRPFPTSSIQ